MGGFNCSGVPENMAIRTLLLRSAILNDILRSNFFFGNDRERLVGLLFAFRDEKNDGGLVSFAGDKRRNKEECKVVFITLIHARNRMKVKRKVPGFYFCLLTDKEFEIEISTTPHM